MITIEQLRAVDHIVTHKDCADGVSSAMILKDVIPDAKVSFVQHNTKEQKEFPAEPGQLWCDFIPAKDRVKEFVDVGAFCLDHHKKAQGVVEAFGENGIFADEEAEPGVCGAVLAYRHVWLPLQGAGCPSPEIDAIVRNRALLAGVRDTWQKKDPRWQEACEQAEAVKWWPLEDIVGSPVANWDGMMQPIGRIFFSKNLSYAKYLAESGYRFTTPRGTRVLLFGGISMSSDAAEAADTTADVVVGFGYKVEAGVPGVIFSTRSHTGYDVGAFCVAHGGGGHTKAAGFSVPLDILTHPNPFKHFQQVLEVYEQLNPQG